MKSRGAVTFVFDDGYKQTFEHAVPILDSFGLPGVFALPLEPNAVEKTEHREVMSWQSWKQLLSPIHEIAAHGVNHLNLTTCDATTLSQELAIPAQNLGAATLVYPGGAHSKPVADEAGKHYSAARTLVRTFETIPPKDPLRLASYDFTRKNFSVAKANMLALWAYITNSWLIETYHIVDDNETEKHHAVSAHDFKKHVSFVHRLPVSVVTIKEMTHPHHAL